jgi:hypothetical protein
LNPPERIEVRPRSTGEILDDAWRLYLAHAPQLLALSGLFLTPAAVALLLLLALPAPPAFPTNLLLPAVTAALLPLTGLGSGACQEAFRRLAEGRPVELLPCLGAALRRGPAHLAARALVLMPVAVGLIALGATGVALLKSDAALPLFLLAAGELFAIGLCLWPVIELHPFLAEGTALLQAVGQIVSRTLQLHPGKAAAIVLSRLLLHVFAVLNLYLLAAAGLWVAGNLAGLDTALAGVVVSLGNPVCVVILVLLGWLLLAPFSEAAGFLLHADLRARYEGLDLWYRVERHFPPGERRRVGAAVLALLAVLLFALPVRAEDRLRVVQQARGEVQKIAEEVRSANPYPGSARWVPRLRAVGERLGEGAPRDPLWFDRAIEGFDERGREGALHVLTELDHRLALMEEALALPRERPGGDAGQARPSSAEIKKLLPRAPDGSAPPDPGAEAPPGKKKEDRKPVRRDEDEEPARLKARGPGLVGPNIGCGPGALVWLLLAGLFLGVLAVAGVLFRRWRRQTRLAQPVETGPAASSVEEMKVRPEQSAAVLWRRAEQMAQAGRFLEAVRVLYLAVLTLLHRANLIRYERTHTNGEYLQQLRQSSLHAPFRQLVRRFEEKWYGERSCQPEDYDACHGLAEEIREGVRD